MMTLTNLHEKMSSELGELIVSATINYNEITLVCSADNIKTVLNHLKQNQLFAFDELIDICGVDYLLYGVYDWETDDACEEGFSRGVERQPERAAIMDTPRFAVVYHLRLHSISAYASKCFFLKIISLLLQFMISGKPPIGLKEKLTIYMGFYLKITRIFVVSLRITALLVIHSAKISLLVVM